MKAERDEWRDIALRGLGVAEQSTAHAEILANQALPDAAPEGTS